MKAALLGCWVERFLLSLEAELLGFLPSSRVRVAGHRYLWYL